jgi:V8-like Glu-specific endopeptidase
MRLHLPFLLLTFFSGNALASKFSPEIIYGNDNRKDTFESDSVLFQKLASSTAAHIAKENIKFVGKNAELRGPALSDIFRLCSKERFRHQPFIANCSGFLVAPDMIATAGHCFQTGDSCKQYHWVFNYKVSDSTQTNVTVDASDVYKCKEVIKASLTRTTDFALIRLDRKVEGVSPVKISKELPKLGTEVVLIGHPSGLPQKITDGGKINAVSETEFKANLDAFQINSGSAVFNAKSGELLGVLVRGQTDYRANDKLNCTEVNTTSDDEEGEDVASFTQFIEYLK